MPRKKDDHILHVPKNATMRQIYAIAKKQFTAADLQKYTEIETGPMMSFDAVLAGCERVHKEELEKMARARQRKKRK